MAIDSGLLFGGQGLRLHPAGGLNDQVGFLRGRFDGLFAVLRGCNRAAGIDQGANHRRKSGAASSTKNGFNGHEMLLLGDCRTRLVLQNIVLNDDFRNY